ncbi:hypothetical protein FG05_30645 [Fusarium graminearum]|nr:hypothetical protein FG05_30645 [Fusarium graminearum]
MKSRQVKAFTAESIRQDLMDLIERQVKPWMETCQEQGAYHQNCTKKKNTANLPTRLVDVGQIDDDLREGSTICYSWTCFRTNPTYKVRVL